MILLVIVVYNSNVLYINIITYTYTFYIYHTILIKWYNQVDDVIYLGII